LPICLTHALAAPLPALESGLALVGSGALLAVRQVALASASVESLAFPIVDPRAWHFALLGLGAAGLLLGRFHERANRGRAACWVRALSLALVVVELSERRAARHAGLLKVNALDVGQGDATLVGLPDGGSVLIDGGGFVGSPVDPGQRVVLPWLRAERRQGL